MDGKMHGNPVDKSEGIPMSEFIRRVMGNIDSDSQIIDGGSESSGDESLFFASIKDAEAAVLGLYSPTAISADRLLKKQMGDWVVSHKEVISGSTADWHNLASRFFQFGDYRRAFCIAQAGLSRFPNDASLLGDAIRCAGELGDWAKGNELLAKATNSDYRSGETWTLSVYVVDYLKQRARTEDASSRNRTYDEALAFLRDAKDRINVNDKLLNSEAELLIESGRVSEARELLEDVVFMDDQKNGSPNPERRPTPQCCLTYLDEILADSCDYAKIIGVCDAGIRFSAEEQKSVNVGYFLYRKALAMDAQILAQGTNGIGNQDYVRNALKTYSLASKLHDVQTYQKMCRDRFIILCGVAGIDDMDVSEYVRVNQE